MTDPELLNRRIKREIAARREAENILEQKSLELYEANQKLVNLNAELEQLIADRTAKLSRSEKRYRTLIDGAHDIIFVTDEFGMITYINHVAETRFGHIKEDIVGTHFSTFINPDFREEIITEIAEATKQKLPSYYIEVPSYKYDGEKIWLGQNLQFTYGEEGFMTETVSIARDITAQKKEEAQLISTQLQLRSLVNNMSSGVLFLSNRGEILQVNEFFISFFELGTNHEELIGRNVVQIKNQVLSHFEDPEKHLSDLQEAPEKRLRIEMPLKDGRFIEFDFIPIFSEGTYLGTLWQFIDTTTRKELELEIRNSEEKYRGIIENMELGLLEVDENGTIIHAYDWFCKMTGYSEKELIGRNGRDFLLPDEFQEVLDSNHKKRAEGEQSVYEVQLIRKDGSRIWVIISGAPYYNMKGDVAGSIGIHFDVTDQKNLQSELIVAKEEAERAQEAEKQFLANMSHEIRTPLNAVIGMSHLLYDTNPTKDQKEYLEMIQYSANLLSNLVTDVLDFSKITSGVIDVNESTFNFNSTLQTLYKTFKLKARNKPIEIKLVAPEFITLIKGDETLINQVLYNLLGNAEKFTEEGSITIQVETIEKGNQQRSLHIDVIDTGIGIPENKLENIFAEFSQADRETKLKYGGTGLGLAICKRIIQILDGSISVKSIQGKGSTFSVEIPVVDTGENVQVLDLENHSISHGKSVLVVEDNVMNQNYISRLLDKENVKFKIANNGQEAFNLCKQELFDLIFMDISMPVMDGYEATIKIRNSDTLNVNTTIVALTASALSTKKHKAYEVGMNDYMTKPFTPFELKKLLSLYLGTDEREDDSQAEGAADSNEQALDQESLEMFYGGDAEYALEMFSMFLDQVDENINGLEDAIDSMDFETGQKLAHKMKPTFSMVGAPKLQAIFAELENSLRYKDQQAISTHWLDAKASLAVYLPAIRNEHSRLRSTQ